MNVTPTSSRARRVVTSRVEDKLTPAMRQLAGEFYRKNAEANMAARAAEAARKALLTEMVKANVTGFTTETQTPVGVVALDVKLAASKREKIDVALLRKKVTDETFMQCVSATKSAVVEFAGEAIATACATTVEGETNVSVKAVK